MGKWAKYRKHHKMEWEDEQPFKGWLTSKQNGSSYCKICNIDLRAHRSDLIRHSQTTKHKLQASKIGRSQLNLKNFGVAVSNNSMKRKEIILASYVASHSTIRSIDHLSEILNRFSKDGPTTSTSTVNQDTFHLHKTKCAAIIRNVLAPSLLKDLIEDLGNSYFSLILDESTDVTTEKLLCINIKYYSVKSNNIKLQFLTFIAVVKTTAQDLYEAVANYLLANKFNIKQLIGIGTDGASNMCGAHNSLYTLLKKNFELNHLVLVKCICHSLHLCSSKASEVFSDEIDFILRETYNWFRYSTIRLNKYKDIYNLINTGSNFKKLTQLSATRWLSRYRAVEKILTQYLELETFFNIHAEKERCHTAQLLSDAYKNKQNKIILIFVKPILKQIFNLNIYFQKESLDYFQAFNDINAVIWTFARQIMKPSLINHLNDFENLKNSMMFNQNYLPLNICDFGYEFEQELKRENLSAEKVTDIQEQCKEFLKILIQELIKRMPTHLNVFSQVKNISPKIIINTVRPKFNELPIQFMLKGKLSDIETQYRQLLSVHWEQVFEGNIPEDSNLFWSKVIKLKNAAGESLFEDISTFAFTLLSLPSSNASVERSFSIMNVIKCKLRNKMLLNLLNSIMLVRAHFHTNNLCCKIFEPTQDMLSRFNSKMYESDNEADEDIYEILSIVDM